MCLHEVRRNIFNESDIYFTFRRRDIHRKKAKAFLREGKKAEARESLQRCIDVTPEMALQLMKVKF